MIESRVRACVGKRVRPALVALALAGTAAAAPAPRPAEAAPRLPVLGRKTVVKGSATAGMRVRIPRRVTIDPEETVRIHGGGRIAGVVLTDPDVARHERDSLEAIRFGYCDGAGCNPAERSEQYLYARDGTDEHAHGGVALGPGTYLLYLIADSAPVRVTLRFDELAGRKVLRPRAPAGSGFAVPSADNATESPGSDSFWWGDEFDVTGAAGYVFAILRMDVENWLDLHYGDCAYVESAPPPRPLAYSPPCPGGIGIFTNESSDVPASKEFEVPMFAEFGGAGHFGYGLYYTGAADVTDRFSLFFHLSLDPAAL